MKKTILLLLLLMPIYAINAHPHMGIYGRYEIEIEDNQVKGLWVIWEFDRFFSEDTIMMNDLNRNRQFEQSEISDIYTYSFSSLRDFNFFIYFRVENERFSPERVESFTAYITPDGYLAYKFYVKLDNFTSRNFYLSIYDFSHFCACTYIETGEILTFNSDASTNPAYTLGKNEDYPVYYNPYAGVGDTTTYSSWEPGLETLIIDEFHITF